MLRQTTAGPQVHQSFPNRGQRTKNSRLSERRGEGVPLLSGVAEMRDGDAKEGTKGQNAGVHESSPRGRHVRRDRSRSHGHGDGRQHSV